MARYVDIECDAVTEVLPRRAFKTRQDIQDFLDNILAADVAPVVYCKDCKYADTERRNATEKRYFNSILFCRNSNLCGDEPLAMWPDDFCSYGERKDGGAE